MLALCFRAPHTPQIGKNMNFRMLIILIAVGMAVGVANVAVPRLLHGSKTEQINEGLVKACVEINKTCPKTIDEYTRLDSATPGNLEILYNYTITNLSDADLMKSKDNIIKVNTETIMTNPSTKKLIDYGVTMKYLYKNMAGVKMFDFFVKK